MKVIFPTIKNCSKRKEFAPSGGEFFHLREVPILKRDSIEENNCLIQSPLDVRNFLAYWLRPL